MFTTMSFDEFTHLPAELRQQILLDAIAFRFDLATWQMEPWSNALRSFLPLPLITAIRRPTGSCYDANRISEMMMIVPDAGIRTHHVLNCIFVWPRLVNGQLVD